MEYKENNAVLRAMCEARGVPLDVIDFRAEWDSSLTQRENYAHIAQLLDVLAERAPKSREPTSREIAQHAEALELQQNAYLSEQTKLAEDEAIKAIKTNASVDANKHYESVRDFVRLVARKQINSAVIVGRGGLGKTHAVLSTLASEGQTLGVDYEVVNTHVTALGLYKFLYRNSEKTIVLDDCDGMLADETIVGLLKSAMWSATPVRAINWVSSRELDVPDRFVFNGRIIVLLNDVPDSKAVGALLTRSFFKEVEFSHDELTRVLFEVAKAPYKDLDERARLEVAEFLRETADETVKDYNLRTLFKAFELRRYSEEKWRGLVREMLEPNEELVVLREVMREFLTVSEQVKAFGERTGLSRRTFFRLKKKLVPKCRGSAVAQGTE